MSRLLAPSFLIGAGLIGAGTALLNVLVEPRLIDATPLGGLIEFLLLAVPAAGLVYAGYWLWVGDFAAEAVRRIGTFAVGGAVIAAVATALFLSQGSVPAAGPVATFVLFVGTATEGSLLGVLAGTFVATHDRFRRERTAADQYETLHALLRHDFRNRLTIIGGHLTRLAETTDAAPDSVETIEAQLDAIEALLEDTRVATEAIEDDSALEPVDLVSVARRHLSLLEESYETVSVSADLPDAAFVSADDLLGSVLDNVFSNAVSHNDQSTAEVEVTLDETAGPVRLTVADNGPGIPPERRDEVFEPGVGEGTGMGLYLVETVVERYGGEVTIADNEPRGTVVTVTLPRADA